MDNIDFAALALQDADFAEILKPNDKLDFTNPAAVLQLTKTLMKIHFNLKIELPPDRLCPPVPNRLNYIRWIQTLLDTTDPSYSDTYDPNRQVIGLDIGTGASCVYPLLGCSERPNWTFFGTEIDPYSLHHAHQNINLNALHPRISLLHTTPTSPLIPVSLLPSSPNLTFTICNPPFYTSTTEMHASAAKKALPPSTACTGSPSEMIYEGGGEVGFVARMIEESLVLRESVRWYSSMLGKFESAKEILAMLRKKGIQNYAVKELIQGSKTKRWAIAWSFHPLRPSLAASRAISSSSSLPKSSLPFPTEISFTLHTGNISQISSKLHTTLTSLTSLCLKWTLTPSSSKHSLSGIGFTPGNIWSRASRRRKDQKKSQEKEKNKQQDKDEDAEAFGFKISVSENEGRVVLVRWSRGMDSVVFESFCGMVRRRLTEDE